MKTLARFLIALAAVAAAGCATTAGGGAEEESWIQTSDGVLLHYRRLGAGPATLVVPGESWVAADMQRLARGRTVVFYDLRGRGRSDAHPTTDLERDLADLEEVRAWLKLERMELLGIDYQGALAAHYAARHPQRVSKLVIVSPVPLRKFPHWKIYDRVYNERQDPQAVARLNQLKAEGFPRKDPEAWAEIYGRTLMASWARDPSAVRSMKSAPFVSPNHDPELQLARYFDMLRSWGDWDWRTTMSGLACATLVIFGEDDPMPVQASREWAAVVPGGREAVVERSGRLPWIENPAAFFAAVDGFLD